MRKIKKFKINLRFREILRLLKSTAQVSEITPQLEEAVKREKSRIESQISPASVYETLPNEKIDFDIGVETPEKWVSTSFYIVTIGKEVEQEIEAAQGDRENILGKVLHAVFLEAVEQSANFVGRLLNEEAKEAECELSKRQRISSYTVLEKIFSIVPADKIGVKLFENMTIQPQYTTCGVYFWVPQKKRSPR